MDDNYSEMHALFLDPEPDIGGPTDHGNDDVVQVSDPRVQP